MYTTHIYGIYDNIIIIIIIRVCVTACNVCVCVYPTTLTRWSSCLYRTYRFCIIADSESNDEYNAATFALYSRDGACDNIIVVAAGDISERGEEWYLSRTCLQKRKKFKGIIYEKRIQHKSLLTTVG